MSDDEGSGGPSRFIIYFMIFVIITLGSILGLVIYVDKLISANVGGMPAGY